MAEFDDRRDRFLAKIGRRPVVMGILNITPDSFSDGGKFLAADRALAKAQEMAAQGCDIIDVGGESTRPGATPVPELDELARIEPIVAELNEIVKIPISIDTYKANVARRACRLGAVVVNDIWGLQKDPEMAKAVGESRAAAIIMHNREVKDESINIVADMFRFFDISLALADRAGIAPNRIILDPGVGFGKTSRQHLEAIAAIPDLKRRYGLPILVGLSRKSFLGSLLNVAVHDRLIGTLAANLAAAVAGADIFRVHDVGEHITALKVFQTIRTIGPHVSAHF